MIGRLYRRAIGNRVTEGNADLDSSRARLRSAADGCVGGVEAAEARRDERNQVHAPRRPSAQNALKRTIIFQIRCCHLKTLCHLESAAAESLREGLPAGFGGYVECPRDDATRADALRTMSFADHFDRLYIINLPQRKDRWRHVQRELERIGVLLKPGKVERFEAIRPESADGFESAGRRGVFMSHFAIVQRALRDGLSSVVVLEDDVAFTPAMLEHGNNLAGQLRQIPWHIALLGYLEIDASPEALRELVSGPAAWLPLPGPRIGSHFYALHGDVLPALVEYMGQVQKRPPGHPQGARMGADATYNMFCSLHPQFRALIARPNLAGQIRSASDLMPNWMDQVPVLRELRRGARALRGRKEFGPR